MQYTKLKPNLVACQIELTNICSLGDCAECARPYMTRPLGSMPFELCKLIIKECVDTWGNISFNLNGLGEPLLYAKLPDVIRYIGEISPKSRIEIFSSLVCDKSYAQKVAQAMIEVPNKFLFASSLHLYNRFGRRIKKIEKLFQFDTFYDCFKAIPLEKIDFHIALNVTKYLTQDRIDLFKQTFRGYLPEDRVHVVEKLDPWFDLVRDNAVACSDVTEPSVCDYPFRVLHFGWNGDILICCTDDVHGEMVVEYQGYRSCSLKEVWEGEFMSIIRDAHNALDVKHYMFNPCNRCGRTKGYKKR